MKLKDRLKELGLSQVWLARITGVSVTTVNAWCVGRTAPASWLHSWLYMWERTEPLERARMRHAKAHEAAS